MWIGGYTRNAIWLSAFFIRSSNFVVSLPDTIRLEDANGLEVLKHKCSNKVWTSEARLELVMQVMAGKSIGTVSVENGIYTGM